MNKLVLISALLLSTAGMAQANESAQDINQSVDQVAVQHNMDEHCKLAYEKTPDAMNKNFGNVGGNSELAKDKSFDKHQALRLHFIGKRGF